jgi:DNA-binding MarR family transcriptional regulator
MTSKLITQALEAVEGEPPLVQLIYVRLATASDKKGCCRARQDEVARVCGCSVDTVKRAMKALEEAGLILRQFQHRRDGRRKADLVFITPDKVAVSTIVKARQGGCEPLGQGCGKPLGQGGCEHSPVYITNNTIDAEAVEPSQEDVSNRAANDPRPLVVISGGRAA